jgi:hypothetical protein
MEYVGIFYGHLVYILCGHLLYFMVISYICWLFGTFFRRKIWQPWSHCRVNTFSVEWQKLFNLLRPDVKVCAYVCMYISCGETGIKMEQNYSTLENKECTFEI